LGLKGFVVFAVEFANLYCIIEFKTPLQQYLPIAPIASRRSASCTIANSRVGSTIDFFETSFLNPAIL